MIEETRKNLKVNRDVSLSEVIGSLASQRGAEGDRDQGINGISGSQTG
jgi:hypothetical protein